MKLIYKYKNYILTQIKQNNYYIISVYNNGNIVMEMKSKRLFTKDESTNYIKYCISYIFKENLKERLVKR